MREKLFFAVLAVSVLAIAACTVPQYQVTPVDGENKENKDITKELEDLTKELDGKPLTEEEKAREEFKKKLLEKQAAGDAQPAEAQNTAEAPKASEAPKTEAQNTAETPKVTEAPKTAETVKATEPAKDSSMEQVITVDSSGKRTITVKEGGLIKLALRATDPDGDTLKWTFEKPLNSDGEWQTKIGDAGRYPAIIKVSDGQQTVEESIIIVVEAVNHPPVLKAISDILVKEGETVNIPTEASDPDGDTLSYTFSGWMNSGTYRTNYNDAGEHTVTVTVSDGYTKDSKTVKITVADVNRPPAIVWG
jgi:hypothetical protein